MENIADKSLFLNAGATESTAPLQDRREDRYQLAVRLADNMRLGEAVRLLESLGDYRDSRALLEEVRALKAYSDGVEAELKAERSRKEQARAQRSAKERRARIIAWVVVAALALLILLTSR